MPSNDSAKTILRALIAQKRGELRDLEAVWTATFGGENLGSATSPSASPGGGGESSAAPAGEAGLQEEPNRAPGASAPGAAGFRVVTTPADRPTRYPSAPGFKAPGGQTLWEERLARWLEGHADGYEHGGEMSAAYALREKANGIRRREYEEE